VTICESSNPARRDINGEDLAVTGPIDHRFRLT
jgi:hypothetical protein